jgi:hypothetical protein
VALAAPFGVWVGVGLGGGKLGADAVGAPVTVGELSAGSGVKVGVGGAVQPESAVLTPITSSSRVTVPPPSRSNGAQLCVGRLPSAISTPITSSLTITTPSPLQSPTQGATPPSAGRGCIRARPTSIQVGMQASSDRSFPQPPGWQRRMRPLVMAFGKEKQKNREIWPQLRAVSRAGRHRGRQLRRVLD